MTAPFIIFALPRSRTAWLAKWLSYGGRKVAHDLSLECDRIEDFIDAFSLGLDGVVDTAAIEAWRLIREARPDIKMVVVFRPLVDVISSLRNAGFPVTPDVVAQLEDRERAMRELAAEPGVMSVEYDALGSWCQGQMIWEHLCDDRFDQLRWFEFANHNIQIDIPARLRRLQARAPAIAALRHQMRAALAQQSAGKWVRIGFEPFATAWPDAAPLATAHFAEVGPDEPWRKFVPVVSVMEELDRKGVMRCVTARRGDKFLGYMTWMVLPDIEASPLVYAQQGAWYAAPEARGVGLRLLRRSISLFRRMGVDYLQMHHRLNGRGQDLSALFRKVGAVPQQHNYNLFLKAA